MDYENLKEELRKNWEQGYQMGIDKGHQMGEIVGYEKCKKEMKSILKKLEESKK